MSRLKRCKYCGAIIYDDYSGDICDVCLEEREEDDDSEDQDIDATEQNGNYSRH